MVGESHGDRQECLGRWRPQRSVPTSGRVGMITGFLNDDFEVPGIVEGFFQMDSVYHSYLSLSL